MNLGYSGHVLGLLHFNETGHCQNKWLKHYHMLETTLEKILINCGSGDYIFLKNCFQVPFSLLRIKARWMQYH